MSIKQLTIDQIRIAVTEKEIETVIENTLEKVKRKNVNGHIVRNYMSTMTTLLLNLKREPLDYTVKDNVNKAIEIYRKLNRSITS
jgi:hypothetical protein